MTYQHSQGMNPMVWTDMFLMVPSLLPVLQGSFRLLLLMLRLGLERGAVLLSFLLLTGLKRVVLILTTVFRFTMQVHRMIINVNFELLQPLRLLAVCSLRRLFSDRKPRSRDTPRIRQTRARAGSAVPVQDTRDNAALAAIANSAGKRPVADLQILGVANLKPSDIGKGVRVRVYRKWTVTSTRGARQPTLSFMLLDQQGGAIQPHVEARERNRFDNALQINGTCKENKARRVAAV